MKVAMWESSEDIYSPDANVKLVSKPFNEFKSKYGAVWIRKPVSERTVNVALLKSLLRRTLAGKNATVLFNI